MHAASPPWTNAPPEPRAFRFPEPVSPPWAATPGWGTPEPRGASTCSADASRPRAAALHAGAPPRRSSRARFSPGGARGSGRAGPPRGGRGRAQGALGLVGGEPRLPAPAAKAPPNQLKCVLASAGAASERPRLRRKGKLRPGRRDSAYPRSRGRVTAAFPGL